VSAAADARRAYCRVLEFSVLTCIFAGKGILSVVQAVVR
jgi:hypothetical protein